MVDRWMFGVVCWAICGLRAGAALATGSLVADQYVEDFDGGPILPWYVRGSFGDGSWQAVLPGDGGVDLSGQLIQSPVLPVLTEAAQSRDLAISFRADSPDDWQSGDVLVTLRPYGDYHSSSAVWASFPLNPARRFFENDTVLYEATTPLSAIARPPNSCSCSGLIVELSSPSGNYLRLDSFEANWSRPAALNTLQWTFGGGTTGLPLQWEQQTFAGRWQPGQASARAVPDDSVPAYSTGSNEELRIDATTPSFRFTDFGLAVYSVDVSFYIQNNPTTDRIVVDLIHNETNGIVKLIELNLFDLPWNVTQAAGKLSVNILEDAFGGLIPDSHQDHVSTYRIRTRVWDEDDDKGTIQYVDFGNAVLSHAVLLNQADFDRSGRTDGADFLAWQRQFNASVYPSSGADANGDGVVDHRDLSIWNLSVGTPAGGSMASTAIPEPQSALLACSALLVLLRAEGASPDALIVRRQPRSLV